uniref:DUF473 domain-containing protein n=1 Tax=Archaeoglobus fulgidus TaxID=2234 RepID=A0A7C3ZEJ8_ARCFL
MRCLVLTGISRNVIEELMRRNIRTVELRSAHNVATALKAEPGDCVFLTPARINDLGKGVSGLIAEVRGKEVMSHSLFYQTPYYMEESEITVVRLILTPKSLGRVVQVRKGAFLETIEGDVVEMSYFEAR